jgi:hypothetical protein
VVAVSGTVAMANAQVTVTVNPSDGGPTPTPNIRVTAAAGLTFHTAGFTLAPAHRYTAVAEVDRNDSATVPFSTK